MCLLNKLAVLIAVLLIVGCEANGEESSQVIYQSVSAVKVHEQSEFAITREFTGVVVPARSADIAFEFGGTVEFMLADEGDRFEEGDLLAQLDTALLEIERRQLQAQLAEARANLRLASANLKRQKSLELDGFASQQRRDELEAARDATKASIAQLQAALDGNQVRQQKAHLYAPFSGVVGERYLEVGSSASAGRPVMRTLETERMEAHVGVPLSLAGSMEVEQLVSIRVGEAVIEAEVLAVGAELKARSHTATVRIQLPEQQFMAGSLVELELIDSISATGFTIPQSALTASLRGLWRVYVLAPAGDDLYKVEARDLQLRYSGESVSFVEGGLSDGELVVTQGVHKIVPGQLVRLVGSGKSS
jgi:RND family efflux transporter MFP subunit